MITPDHRHFEKLWALLDISALSVPKKTPHWSGLDKLGQDETRLNPEDAQKYRSGVGLLLYLASDLLESQNTVRALAQGMARPTVSLMRGLRHLASYLMGCSTQGLRLSPKPGRTFFDEPRTTEGPLLESFSDSDWATDQQSRRSVSAAAICYEGCLLHSSSRTQRVIALSSEVMSATFSAV